MPAITTCIVRSLAGYTPTAIAAVCADAGPFFSPRWLALSESLELPELLHGAAELRFAVALRDGQPAALCPLLIIRSAAVPFVYSLDKYFFTGFSDELSRLDPKLARFVPWLVRLILGYRWVVNRTGARTSGWILATSPLSYRGGIVVPHSAPDAAALRAGILAALQALGRSEDLPVAMFCVEGRDTELRRALALAAFDEHYLYPDMLIRVPKGGLDEYLGSFRSDERRRFLSEQSAARKLGVRFEATHDFAAIAESCAAQYALTYDRYSSDHVHHPASFFRALGSELRDEAAAGVARRGEAQLGFVAELFRSGEQYEYRVGREYTPETEKAAVYFNLMFWSAIARAAQRNVRLLFLGPNSWQAKHRRGAVAHPLYLHWWFPRPLARVLLTPYLRLFAKVTRQQLAAYERPTSGLKPPAAGG